jgi:hypothetical protein
MIIQTEIEINANQEDVWKVFTDFSSYPEWNVYCKKIIGNPMSFLPFIGIDFTFSGVYAPYAFIADVITFPYRFQIKAWGNIDIFFEDVHNFLFYPLSDHSTLFKHEAKLKGMIISFTPENVFDEVRLNHQQMNQSLKERVEKLISSSNELT